MGWESEDSGLGNECKKLMAAAFWYPFESLCCPIDNKKVGFESEGINLGSDNERAINLIITPAAWLA